MRKLCLRRCLVLVLTVLLAAPGVAQPGNPQSPKPTRVVSGLPSATGLLSDLEFVVGKLAGEQETWEETLYPAAEVFLIGVDMERPIGADLVFDREGGQRKQLQIPISDLQEFRDENLEPIDIQSRRRKPDYYQLSSSALGFDGWMRYVDNYASISTQESDVPAGMASPEKALQSLLDKAGYDAAAQLRNDAEGSSDRQSAFAEFRENMLAGITRRPTETAEAFTLRKRLAQHQSERLERLFVQAEQVTAGWITDAVKKEAHGEVLLSALAGTDLATILNRFGTYASYFSAVATTDNSLLHGRINLPIDKAFRQQANEFYELVAPVWKQRIDGDAKLNDTQKTARNKICELALEMLKEGSTLDTIDACLEITPTTDGKHILLGGIRATDGTKTVEILKLIPDALGDLALELDVDKAGTAAIHQFKPTGDVPKTLEAFYGKDQPVYVATSPDAIWISCGVGSLEKLKETIALVETTKGEANGDVFVGTIRLGPMLKHLDDLAVELGISAEQLLGRPVGDAAGDEDEDAGGKKKRKPGQAVLAVDWRGIALPVLLEGPIDHFGVHVYQQEGVIHAEADVEEGVLKAAGKVIATVAAEKLGG
ncbi:MAG: hypothetical protein KDA75_10945 [Planctomycetaceae bacterium]|nr:hypothetical protein [Planctomycetaceae bacterium]